MWIAAALMKLSWQLHAGFEPERVLYTSNGIHFSEIAEAKELGIHINIDSLSNLEKFGAAYTTVTR